MVLGSSFGKLDLITHHKNTNMSYRSLQLTIMGLIGLSVFALVAGFVAEHGFDLKPCVLCWYQRYAYMAAVISGGLGCIMIKHKKFQSFALVPLALSYAANAFIAIYQVLVEQKVIQQPSLCKGVEIVTLNQSFEQFQRQLQAAGEHVPCDQIPWELFGISMAGYNAMLTMLVTILTLVIIRSSATKGVRPS